MSKYLIGALPFPLGKKKKSHDSIGFAKQFQCFFH